MSAKSVAAADTMVFEDVAVEEAMVEAEAAEYQLAPEPVPATGGSSQEGLADGRIQQERKLIKNGSVSLEVELDKATFGKLIEYFKQFATVESNREVILSFLKKFNIKRNEVVHDLFDIRDLDRLALELQEYAELADKIVRLLADYDRQVYENFCELEKRVDFRKYQK